MSSQTAPIVVGYDGSPASLTALHWATSEAVRLHARLRVVEVFELVITVRPTPGTVVPLEAVRTAREGGLAALADGLRAQQPDLEVETVLTEGTPAETLIEESAQARMIILGSRGLGGSTGLLLGSVTVQVSAHAQCPVLVVPPDVHPRALEKPTVVVGVDGSKVSAKAIDFAFDQAEALGARVIAVHAWTSPFLTFDEGQTMLQFDEVAVQESGRVLVAESVAGAMADHPDVECETRLMTGRAARTLLLAAESASLVVVGSRGRGGFTGLLLGSVSQSVLHHAHCPVAIVR
ncbi:nucleotide-binding universal stress UspA family protein [Kribbella steppae]|uniref:Nucleotide-binding universal stress UspA family protein n=1 Tax=Kribbella steppae TaxID=2512223 RepID=A0A4R2H4B3_9ACTN|nr:universal stress protein [Kribbella steppae]TCO20319.1 nucleotide-binding universal stress UspA family protein [Kribbella steppae]